MKESFEIKLSNQPPPLQINDVNGVNMLAFSDTDKIEALNTYFSSISTIDDTNVTLPYMYSLCNNNLSNIIIEEQEISDIITILPVNKAVGPDCTCMSQNIEINQIQLSLFFLFLQLANPFIQKQVGQFYKTDVIQQE